jgi:hypothetical protein
MAMLLAVFGPSGTAQVTEANGPATRPAVADARPVIKVKTATEFVKALGPDRILELDEGEFALSDVPRGAGAHFKWVETWDGYELLIRNCSNLTIRGTGASPSHVVTRFMSAYVFTFDKCDRLELVNLKLGHAPKQGECTGGVVKVTNGDGLLIRKADLYGCGTEGLTFENVRNARVTNTLIHDCTYGVLSADECAGLRFENCSFRRIKEFHGFSLGTSTEVAFVDCVVEDVAIREPLFKTSLSDPDVMITFKGGAIRNSQAKSLVNTPGMLKLLDTKDDGNLWRPMEE